MSPEKHSRSEKAINADIVELGLKEYYLSEKLQPGSPVEIPRLKSRNDLIEGCENEEEGVFQGLRAELRAGHEIFGIVDVFAKTEYGIMEGTAITRHMPNQRAELISFVNPDGITEIGRKHNHGLDNTVSSNHLALSFNDKGGINIMDMGSTNGTQIFRHKKPGSKNTAIENPVHNINNWSLKSAEIKQIMLGAFEIDVIESSQHL